jgi:hypothetical protein
MSRSYRRAVKRSFDALETSVAAASTVSARVPILIEALAFGSPKAMAETQRMVLEKMAAAAEGSIAAGSAWMRLWLRAGSGLGRPLAIEREVARIVDAAHAPSRRRVRANARRLTRAKRSRSKA